MSIPGIDKMDVESIQAAIRTRPFKPFMIRTASGGAFPVRHPETIAVSPDVSVVLVIPGPGQTAMIDLEGITEITYDFSVQKASPGE